MNYLYGLAFVRSYLDFYCHNPNRQPVFISQLLRAEENLSWNYDRGRECCVPFKVKWVNLGGFSLAISSDNSLRLASEYLATDRQDINAMYGEDSSKGFLPAPCDLFFMAAVANLDCSCNLDVARKI